MTPAPVSPAQLNIPSEVYYLVGALIITNIGAIGTIAVTAAKLIWWAAKADSRIDEAKAMAVRAHKRIDGVESES